MRLRPLFVVLAAALFSGCPQKNARPVALVSGNPILRDDFEDELRRLKAEAGDAALSDEIFLAMKSGVLNQMIERRLILDQAKEYGISVNDADVETEIRRMRQDYGETSFDKDVQANFVNVKDWRRRVHDALLMKAVVDEVIGKGLEPDEEELLRYYRSNAGEFALDERVHLRQIVVRSREEAEALRARLKQGEPFAELAAKHSLTPEKERGGDLGIFAKGEMPPEFNQAFKLNPKEVSPVIQSAYGYHLFWVVEKLPARIPPFDEVRNKARERLLGERKENAYRAWIKQLRDQGGVRVFQDEVDKVN